MKISYHTTSDRTIEVSDDRGAMASNGRALATRILLTCGNGDFGRLGHGINACHSIDIPRHVLSRTLEGLRVDQVACGGSHTLVRATDGTVLSFGLNDRGQCGHCPDQHPWLGEPHEVPIPDEIGYIAAGHYHSLAVGKETGTLWAWGDNSSGQLGVGDAVSMSWYPRRVMAIENMKISQVAAGASHSLATSSQGMAFSFGEGGPKLGQGASREYSWVPHEIRGSLEGRSIDRVAAGHMHSACIDSDGRVYTFGSGRHAQLGTGSLDDVSVPKLVKGIQCARDIACGGYHTIASLCGDGSCVSWGADQHGCLGIEDDSQQSAGHGHRTMPDRVANVTDARMVSAGWKHSAAIDFSGRIYSWGWGGSQGTALSIEGGGSGGGQLGLGDDCDAWYPRRIDTIDVENALRIPQQQHIDGLFVWKAIQVSCGLNHTAILVEMCNA